MLKNILANKCKVTFTGILSLTATFLLLSTAIGSAILPALGLQGTSCVAETPKSATASGHTGNYIASNAIDGTSAPWADNSKGAWLKLDLGTPQTVCGTNIKWYSDKGWEYSFSISVSTDGTSYTRVYSGKSSGVTKFDNYDFTDINARYIKIMVNGNNANNYAVIDEVTLSVASSTKDTTPPTIIAPANINAQATGTYTQVNLGTPFVKDNVDPSPIVTNNAPSQGFPVGTTTVTWTATDHSGNSATADQKVTITTGSPSLSISSSISGTMATATASGGTLPYSYTYSVTSGSKSVMTGSGNTFDFSTLKPATTTTYTVTFTVTDAKSSKASTSQSYTVTVGSNTAPKVYVSMLRGDISNNTPIESFFSKYQTSSDIVFFLSTSSYATTLPGAKAVGGTGLVSSQTAQHLQNQGITYVVYDEEPTIPSYTDYDSSIANVHAAGLKFAVAPLPADISGHTDEIAKADWIHMQVNPHAKFPSPDQGLTWIQYVEKYASYFKSKNPNVIVTFQMSARSGSAKANDASSVATDTALWNQVASYPGNAIDGYWIYYFSTPDPVSTVLQPIYSAIYGH